MQTEKFVDTRAFLSETKFYDSYSRFNEELGKYEIWTDAVERVISMHRDYYKQNGKLEIYLDEAQKAYNEQRVLGAQRALQFGGLHCSRSLQRP